MTSKVRSKKIPRPQNATSSSSSAVINSNAPKNNIPNRKRGSHGFKNPSPPKKMDAFSTTSSDDDDDKIVFPLWRPNNNKNGHVCTNDINDF